MTTADQFRRDFYRALHVGPLEPDDSRYVPLWERDPNDPIDMLRFTIESGLSQSAQLFSGYRGSGKSTQLRRLRKGLKDSGRFVVLCDIEDYLSLTEPVDVVDFLLVLAGALHEGLVAEGVLSDAEAEAGYFQRFWTFVTKTQVDFDGLNIKAGPGELKLALKAEPSFRQQLRQKMATHLGAFTTDVHEFVRLCVQAVRSQHGQDAELVVLVDSVEKLKDATRLDDRCPVLESVAQLFSGHADKLHLPGVHVVYTVPPYLRVKAPGISGSYMPGGLHVLPQVKVAHREQSVAPLPGRAKLRNLIERRGDWSRLLSETQLERLIDQSGGYVRDLVRLLAETCARARVLPADDDTLTRAISQVRSEYGILARSDAVWLQRIDLSHDIGLPRPEDLSTLVWFLDHHLVLGYRNGEEWYAVHPLLRGEVAKLAATPDPAVPLT